MTDAVLDPSVVLKWFHSQGEGNVEAARRVRAQFEDGELRVLAPPLLWLEVLNVAARRWGWSADRLQQLAARLQEIGFELVEPEPSGVARWAAVGLTAYDAAYAAVAEQCGAMLITDDQQVLGTAPGITVRLVDAGGSR